MNDVIWIDTASYYALKRGGCVYTEVVPDCTKATLQGIIRGRVDPDSVIHSDGWRGYDGLVDLGYKSIIEFTMVTMSSPTPEVTSTALNPSGHSPSVA